MLYEIERPVKFYMKLGGYSEIILNWMAIIILSIKLCGYDEIKSNWLIIMTLHIKLNGRKWI